jgi:hypothetical protein
LIDTDPLMANPSDIYAIKPLETWVGGARLYKQGDGR